LFSEAKDATFPEMNAVKQLGLTRYIPMAVIAAAVWGCDNEPAEGKVHATVASAVSAASTPAAAAASAVLYTFSNEGSEFAFTGAKITDKHDGSFQKFSGSVRLVDNDPEKSSVVAEIDMPSVKIEPAKLEGHLKSPDFFDIEKYPKAKFQSTQVKKQPGADGATHTITGDLTLHGTTKSITFPAKVSLAGDNVKVEAEFAINRKDFGIVYPGMPDDLIKDDVLIKLKLNGKQG
jgi:polyisoprenoid-binding protein YceI